MRYEITMGILAYNWKEVQNVSGHAIRKSLHVRIQVAGDPLCVRLWKAKTKNYGGHQTRETELGQ